MTPPKRSWSWCNRPGCDTKLLFARRVGNGPGGGHTLPYEYDDRAPFSVEATGCHVLIAGEAWIPGDLIEDFQTRLGISDEKARELVSGYPFHRPHSCDPTPTDDQSTEDAA